MNLPPEYPIKRKITDLQKMTIEEQKKAVRSGYDMEIIPSDLAIYGDEEFEKLELYPDFDTRILREIFAANRKNHS